MSFFKEFKEDLSQAVNELMPGAEENVDKEDILVNTFDDEIDVESELSKLDGLLEKVSQNSQLLDKAGTNKSETTLEADEKQVNSFFQNEKTETLLFGAKDSSTDAKVISDLDKEIKADVKAEDKLDNKNIDSKAETSKESEVIQKETLNEKEEQKEDKLKKQEGKFGFYAKNAQSNIMKTDVAINIADDKKEERSNNKEEVSMNAVGANKEVEEVTSKFEVLHEIEVPSSNPEATDETAVITAGTAIKGNINSNGSIDMQGEIEGNLECKGKLVVTGTVKGNSSSAEFFADSAKVEGEVVSSGTVKIGLGSVVIGNIKATSAVIAGAIKGDIDVKGPVVVDTSAVVMGNIKSRSVQINNGAVIEGFCSQCYAEINMESLFGEKKGKK